tara:strand:- start:63232 stop:64347 length:1116 start_codon:yes stop_codon:yes gene_type:complete
MIVGVLKEIKEDENRVAITPAGVELLVNEGHTVLIESNAGLGSSISNEAFTDAGATLEKSAKAVYDKADMILKVKEPLPQEYKLIRSGQIVFTFFHFAASQELTQAMIDSGCTAITYETIETKDGKLPLLTPMSEVAGRMSIHEASKYLERKYGGRGILLGGVPGVEPAQVVVLGGGVVGTNAAKMAAGLGAKVFILDISLDRLRYLHDIMPPNVVTMASTPHNIRELLTRADVVIGGVLIPGAKAPKLITRKMLSRMKPGAVMVDVAIDQGGSFETSKPTTHDDPIFNVDGIIHYCVCNIPGAMPITSTQALTNATLPYALKIAKHGCPKVFQESPEISKGVNIINGKVTHQGVAKAFDLPYVSLEEALS